MPALIKTIAVVIMLMMLPRSVKRGRTPVVGPVFGVGATCEESADGADSDDEELVYHADEVGEFVLEGSDQSVPA